MPSPFRLIPLLFALTSASVLAQENHIDTVRPDAPVLAPYGAHAVGVTTIKLVHKGQADVVHAKAGEPVPVYDRPLTVEVWYPAKGTAGPGGVANAYRVVTRDGKTEATLYGRAARDAAPDVAAQAYPLLIISHGYPGNRYLLADLGENLASKGYVVASIDHTDSNYGDMGAFGSTLLNRPLDQLFVLGEMARLNGVEGKFKGLIDANRTGLIGYSMGGYGVLNTVGAGFVSAAVSPSDAAQYGLPAGALAAREAGNAAYVASQDSRIKAAMVFAPWGWNKGFWDAAGLSGIHVPMFFVAGSVDDVAGYSPGVRNLYEGAVNAPRYLLTFENANHNAGAPIPAPRETWLPAAGGKPPTAGHYADAVWDSVRMNNIAEHFATAFFGKYIDRDGAMDQYLDVPAGAKDWPGFAKRSSAGLKLEKLAP